MKPLLDFIRQENPHIILGQEVYDSNNDSHRKNFRTIGIIKKELSYDYIYFSPAFYIRSGKGKIDDGNAIISKFPIISEQTVFFDGRYGPRIEGSALDNLTERQIKEFQNTPRNIQRAEISINNFTINVFNTQGVWGLDGKDNEKRLKMSRIITEEIKKKENIILAGDFNVNPDTKSIKNIENYLINVFKGKLNSTFNMKRKTHPKFNNAVVDMVFVSKNIKVIDSYCPQVDVSDHLPLVFILEI